MLLRVAQVIPRTEAEGPGHRFAVWVQGCPIRCPGCCNPEMFSEAGGQLVEPEVLVERAVSADVEGISLLGGEPFAQAEVVAHLAELTRARRLSVMVFSGYTLAELQASEAAGVRALLAACDLLVDGRFEQSLLDRSRRWIGSRNQVLHFLSDRYRPTDPRFSSSNTAEIRLERGQLVMNGWPALVPALPLRKAPR